MATYRTAVSLIAPTVIEMWKDGIDAIRQGANLIETRLDCLKPEEKTHNKLEFLMSCFSVPIIITNRHSSEANYEGQKNFKGTPKYQTERIKFLGQAVKLREKNSGTLDFIDLEYRHFHEIERNPNKTKLILSWHDFNETPSYKELEKIYGLIASAKPDIVKIAAMVEREEDIGSILNLIRNHSHNSISLIAVGMSELGVKTRIEGPKLGAYLTYACLGGKQAAPGQITLSQLHKAWEN